MNDTNFENRESVPTPIRDEDQQLLQFQQNIQVTTPKSPSSPFSYTLSGNYGDISPPGTYYATVQSSSSHRYAQIVPFLSISPLAKSKSKSKIQNELTYKIKSRDL